MTDIWEGGNLLAKFQQNLLHIWWLGLKIEYCDLINTANDSLLPFGSTILWGFFPAMTTIIAKYHNYLNMVPDFQMTVSQSIKSSQDIKNDKYLIKLLYLNICYLVRAKMF